MSKRTKDKRPEQESGTRERILRAATRLFSRKGYDGTSTKEICEAAKVNIAAIHYHFSAKEKLYAYIIESYGDERLQSVRRILEVPKTKEEFRVRLEMFIKEAVESMLSQRELCHIVQSEIELLHARSAPVFKRTFLKRFEILVNFLSHAKKKGFVDSKVDPAVAARMLFSQICHQTRTDAVHQKYYGVSLNDSAYRALWLKQTVSIFIEGTHAKSR